MSVARSRALTVVKRMEDIPDLGSEAEEDDFWSVHSLADELWDQAKPLARGVLPPARSRTRSVAIRFDEHTLRRARNLAAHLNVGYQTLLKEFIAERLYEEERREGLIKTARRAPLGKGRPDSDLTAASADTGGRRRTQKGSTSRSSILQRTSTNKRGRKNSDL